MGKRLTKRQIEAIKDCKEKNDNCIKTNKKTMDSLVEGEYGKLLTNKQIEVIKNCKEENDNCTMANKKTMDSLVEGEYAKYTEGFGFGYGAIIELTEKGKLYRYKLLNERR